MSGLALKSASAIAVAVIITASAAQAAPAERIAAHPTAFCGPGMYEAPWSPGNGQMSCYACPKHPRASPRASIVDQCGTPPQR